MKSQCIYYEAELREQGDLRLRLNAFTEEVGVRLKCGFSCVRWVPDSAVRSKLPSGVGPGGSQSHI